MELDKKRRSKKLWAFIDFSFTLGEQNILRSSKQGTWCIVELSTQNNVFPFNSYISSLKFWDCGRTILKSLSVKMGFSNIVFFKPNFLRKWGHATTLLLLTQVSPLSTSPWTPNNGTCWPSSKSATSSLNAPSGIWRDRVCCCSVWGFFCRLFCLFVCFGFLQRWFWHYFPFTFGVLFVQITVSMRPGRGSIA